MLQGNTLKMQPLKKTELITHPVEMRLSDAYEAYYNYLDEGYIEVDAPASGDIDLRSLVPGKYLVRWKTYTPTGTLNVSVAKTLTGTSGAHEAVVIMGVHLDYSGRIDDYGLDVTFDLTPSNDYALLTFRFLKIGFVVAAAEEYTSTQFQDCTLTFGVEHGSSSWYYVAFTFLKLVNCYCSYYLSASNPFRMHFTASSATAYNCVFDCLGYDTYGSQTFDWHVACSKDLFYNLVFAHFGGGLTLSKNSGNPTINFSNTLVYDSQLTLSSYPTTDAQSVIHVDQTSFYGVNNYRIVQGSFVGDIFNSLGIYRLETDLIDWDAMETLSAEFVAEREIDRSLFYARASRMYYTARFSDTVMVPDSLKKFGDGYYFVVQREDYEADLIGRTITSGGVLSGSEFQSDENFLVLATDTLGNEAVFAWVDNQMLATVFTDVYDTRTYTITHCFQIWEQYSMSGLSNTIRKPSGAKAITDSPLSGEVKFNNLDNEVIA